MATFTTITTGTDLDEGLVSEELLQELLVENRPPLTARAISMDHDFTSQGASRTQNIVRLKTVAARVQSAEGSELTADDMDLDEESITPTTRYSYRVITFQADKDFLVSANREAMGQGMRAVLDAEDAAGLTKFQDAIASVGSSADVFDLDLWADAKFTYATLDAGGMPIFVGHNIHARDLTKALRNSSGAIEATGRALELFGGMNGFLGTLENIPIFESSNVSETGSAKIGALLARGVLRRGVWNPLDMLVQDAIENLATKLVTWLRSGFTLETNGEASTGADSSIVKVLCQNT